MFYSYQGLMQRIGLWETKMAQPFTVNSANTVVTRAIDTFLIDHTGSFKVDEVFRLLVS